MSMVVGDLKHTYELLLIKTDLFILITIQIYSKLLNMFFSCKSETST